MICNWLVKQTETQVLHFSTFDLSKLIFIIKISPFTPPPPTSLLFYTFIFNSSKYYEIIHLIYRVVIKSSISWRIFMVVGGGIDTFFISKVFIVFSSAPWYKSTQKNNSFSTNSKKITQNCLVLQIIHFCPINVKNWVNFKFSTRMYLYLYEYVISK